MTVVSTAPASGNPRLAPDWVVIETDYRAGMKSLRQIGGEQGISHVAIQKRAKANAWTRDLSKRIQAKAEEKVNKAAVTAALNSERKAVTEQSIVDAGAEAVFNVRMAHRMKISKALELYEKLVLEVEVAMTPPAPVDGQPAVRPDPAKHIDSVKNLAATLERQAFGMAAEDPGDPADPLRMLLGELQKRRSAVPIAEEA